MMGARGLARSISHTRRGAALGGEGAPGRKDQRRGTLILTLSIPLTEWLRRIDDDWPALPASLS